MILRSAKREQMSAAIPRPSHVRLRVLVVEDNLDSVHSMAIIVKMFGHDVAFAINGFAAIHIAQNFQPHVVLLDIGLPDLNGCEIARRLKADSKFTDTRFIAVSALPEHQYRQAALDAGCEVFLNKPVDPRILERLIAQPSSA